jgi:DNA polymerase III subunit delta
MSKNFLLIGDDPYIKEKEIEKIKEGYLSKDDADLNFSTYSPSDIADIMDAVGTTSFFTGSRVVLIRCEEGMPEELVKALKGYLSNPQETSILVITAGPDLKKNKDFKEISKSFDQVSCDRPTGEILKKWIPTFFKNEGIAISREAVNLIVELKGNDTAGIKVELEKLLGYSEGRDISLDDVEELVGRSVTETIFKLVDAINKGDGKWAFNILLDLYEQKKYPTEILGYLGWYVRVIRNIKELIENGASTNEIASSLGYSTGYIKRLSYQARQYSSSILKNWSKELLRTDVDIKTGKKEARLALEMLIIFFTSQAQKVSSYN